MKRLTIIAVGLLMLTTAVAYGLHKEIPSETQVTLPGADAEGVYNYITMEPGYKNWSVWPGTEKRHRAEKPLNIVTTYLNDNAMYSVKKGIKMVDGSIVVTENYDDKGELGAIFVMYKIKGYNPSAGDWFWAQYDPQGKPVVAGRVKACIKCHSSKSSNDYIFTREYIRKNK